MGKLIILVLLLSLAGGIVKILGGIVYCSKALLVDALTSMANFIALVATIYYYRISFIPPDEDHHYGHHRLGYGGTIVSLSAYSFVAGVIIMDLIGARAYKVHLYAPFYASMGFILYLVAIILSRRISEFFKPYAVFTVSELIESCVVIITSLGGALYSYVIDFTGAIALTMYLFYELYSVARELLYRLSDIAPPYNVMETIRRIIESHNVKLVDLRIRMITPGMYRGEAVIEVPTDMTVSRAYRIIKSIEDNVRNKTNTELTITIKASKT